MVLHNKMEERWWVSDDGYHRCCTHHTLSWYNTHISLLLTLISSDIIRDPIMSLWVIEWYLWMGGSSFALLLICQGGYYRCCERRDKLDMGCRTGPPRHHPVSTTHIMLIWNCSDNFVDEKQHFGTKTTTNKTKLIAMVHGLVIHGHTECKCTVMERWWEILLLLLLLLLFLFLFLLLILLLFLFLLLSLSFPFYFFFFFSFTFSFSFSLSFFFSFNFFFSSFSFSFTFYFSFYPNSFCMT